MVNRGLEMEQSATHNQLICLKSKESSCLVAKALMLHKALADGDMLFLSHKEPSFVKDSFEAIKSEIEDFDTLYKQIRFMFLKASWVSLDKMYGKVFFVNEIQKMMKEEAFSTLYFHRADTFFEGASQRDLERILSDIAEIARYYHKRVLFSLNDHSKHGELIDEVLSKNVELEFAVYKASDGGCQSRVLKHKKDFTNIILFSDKKEVVDFHHYLFNKDKHIHFTHITKLDDENQLLLEDADIMIFNLHNISFKDQLLDLISKRKLKTKFFYLSSDDVIRKRDKVMKIEKGITAVFEKNFDLLEYIYTVEKSIGRPFYTSVLKKVNIAPKRRYFSDFDAFKNIVYTYLNYNIYFSIVGVAYACHAPLMQTDVESCIRDLDTVYHDEKNQRLIFLLLDTLPELSRSLIFKRLTKRNIQIRTEQVYDVNQCVEIFDINMPEKSAVSKIETLKKLV